MIPIRRIKLESDLSAKLARRTEYLESSSASSEIARKIWRSAPETSGIRDHLKKMAPGIERCMYCGESKGASIDHFDPISQAPAKTFEWLNHLLACGPCNSNEKRDQFPRDETGEPLLIDPTACDPGEHLHLMLRTGEYRVRNQSPQGTASIRVFGLNRADLVEGRATAFITRGAVLCRASELFAQGRAVEARRHLRAAAREPYASVLHEMRQAANLPGAVKVLGADVVAALQDPAVRAVLRDLIPGAEPPGVTDAMGRSG